MTQMFQSFAVTMRWTGSSSLNSENCDEPSLVETDEENVDSDTEWLYCTVQGCIPETDGAKCGSNAEAALEVRRA